MKKRIISMALAMSMGFVLMACGSESSTDATEESDVSSVSAEEESTAASTDESESESDSNGIITGYAWMAEEEEDAMDYDEYMETFGEVTADQVPEGFSIGVVSMASSNDYWQDLNEGVQERCDELGIEVAIEYVEGSADFEQQLTNAETLYNIGYDAYIYSPENDTCLEEFTKKVVDAGYPVINAYCSEISDATCYVGSMDSETAKLSAQLAIDLVGEEGTVAVAEGDIASKLAQTRTNYFIDYIEKNSNLAVEEIPAEWDPSTARTMTTDLLTANPDVSYIWCNNDDLGLGVYEGLREANATDSCYVVATDGTSAGLSSVAAGELYATFWNNPKLIGRICVDACVYAAIGEDLPRVISMPVEAVTAENVDDYLE